MKKSLKGIRGKDVDKKFILLFLVCILIGLLLIAWSTNISHHEEGRQEIISEFLKELGIVILAVFTISLLYELFVAKKHMDQFLERLNDEIGRGESNFAACARLGIDEVFPQRDEYQRKYPLASYIDDFNSQSKIRIVGQSLNHLMNDPRSIKEAMVKGAQVELCIYDLNSLKTETKKHPDLKVAHIELTLVVFQNEMIEWLEREHPSGGIELKYHQVLIFDSYLYLESPTQSLIIWDWGFGRSLTEHRILKLNKQKPLGVDIQGRYDHVWEEATTVFKYKKGQIVINNLPKAMSNASQ